MHEIKDIEIVNEKEVTVEDYPDILSDLYKFINNYAEFEYLPEVILEYAYKHNFSPELLADIIAGDNSFKLALELNCIKQGTFRVVKENKNAPTTNPLIEDWETIEF
jgi:hypothetical protein